MKRLWLLSALAFIIFSCNSGTEEKAEEKQEAAKEEKYYGLKKITAEGALSADSVISLLDKADKQIEVDLGEGVKTKGVAAKIEGTIVDMCQMSGCWFTFKTKEGKEIMVSMREHKETPKEWAGKTVVAEGAAYIETVSIEELRHKAKEEGASRDELSKIKDPQINYHFIADGAILKN